MQNFKGSSWPNQKHAMDLLACINGVIEENVLFSTGANKSLIVTLMMGMRSGDFRIFAF